MSTSEQPTCGKGLAENSLLPAKMGDLLEAMVESLETHMEALDLTDPNSRQEYEAYESLVRAYRQIAAELQSIAQEMTGYRDLPMGRHDEKAMTHPSVRDSFERFVQYKSELLDLLMQTAERDNKLLEAMRAHSH